MADEVTHEELPQDGTPPPAVPETPQDGTGNNGNDEWTPPNKETFDRILAQKRAANKQEQLLKKRNAELEAEAKKREEAEMNEMELLKKKAEETQQALDAARTEADFMRRQNAIVTAGIKPKFAKIVAHELAEAEADEAFDQADWMKRYKQDNPELFTDHRTQAPQTSGGGPGEQRPLSGNEQAIAEVKAAIAKLPKNSGELYWLERRLRKLEAG